MTDTTLLVGNSFSNQNLYYTTHFLAGDPFAYFATGERDLLITNSMERGRAEKESTVSEVRTFDDFGYRSLIRDGIGPQRAFAAMLVTMLREHGVDRISVEDTFPVLLADELRSQDIALDIDPDLLQPERRRKSETEISAIEAAQRVTEQATSHALDILRRANVRNGELHLDGTPLTSERLRSEVETFLIQRNMETAHAPITAGGPGAADPHWLGSGILRAGESIVLDIFPRSKTSRYFADMTRTVVRGTPSGALRRMYRTVMEAQSAAFTEIRAGANGRNAHRAVETVFEGAGYAGEGPGPRYIHGTGHGLGLDIHEAPYLGSSDMELLENDIVTIEPGLYDPEIGGVRIEDVVLVTRDGYRNLTNFPKEFEI